MEAATTSGVAIEQLHPEYGANQFEISLAPQTPVAAADQLVLTRIIVGRVARRYGFRVSLSPVPFAGSVGSGAHQHFSLQRDGVGLFSDGPGVRGMTQEGESAVAGLLGGLTQAQGVLSGSILSGLRMLPGHWSGATVCWGTENREAAVRFVLGGRGQPAWRQRRGEDHRPVGEPLLRLADDPGSRAGRNRARAADSAGGHGRPSDAHRAAARRRRHRAVADESDRGSRPHWPNPASSAAFSAMRPSMRSSRCAGTSTRPTPTWIPISWRAGSGWRGACDQTWCARMRLPQTTPVAS